MITKFSHQILPSMLLASGEQHHISHYGLLVNFNHEKLQLNNIYHTELPPFSSAIRYSEYIQPSLSCLLFELPENPVSGYFISWNEQETYPGMCYENTKPGRIDFFRSPQEDIATLSFPPQQLSINSDMLYGAQSFKVQANLWFAEAGTHCGIHNKHSFLEIHTQILGVGCMQIFNSEDRNSLCEEFIMAPGITTATSFCHIENSRYIYPYHQYFAETPCVWLALEYHPNRDNRN